MGITVGLLSAGMAQAVVTPRRWGVMLTNRRLLLMAAGDVKITPGIEFSLPRQSVRAKAPPTGRLMSVVELIDAEGNDVLKLHFPAINRADGEALARALG